MSHYKETPSTFLNCYAYILMWGIIPLNDIFVTVYRHNDQSAHWITPHVHENLVLTVQGIVGQFYASPKCYLVDKEVIAVEHIKHLKLCRWFYNHSSITHQLDVQENYLVFEDQFYFDEGTLTCVASTALYGFLSRKGIANEYIDEILTVHFVVQLFGYSDHIVNYSGRWRHCWPTFFIRLRIFGCLGTIISYYVFLTYLGNVNHRLINTFLCGLPYHIYWEDEYEPQKNHWVGDCVKQCVLDRAQNGAAAVLSPWYARPHTKYVS